MLERENMNDYIWKCYFKFLLREDGYKNCKTSIFRGVEAVNRNREQVPDFLWRNILARHIKQYTYN